VFASEFDSTFGAALKPLLGRVSHVLPRARAEDHQVSFSLAGARGKVRVAGFGLPRPVPARWELTLTFGDFSAVPVKRRRPRGARLPLSVAGAVQFNFVTPRRGSSLTADGLFRGFLQLSGAFGGTAQVYGEVENGRVVSLVVTAKHRSLLVGSRRPRSLLSYVSTVAGSGRNGLVDGPGKTARFYQPDGVAVGPDGNLYVADDANNAVREVTLSGKVTTLTKGLQEPTDVSFDGRGNAVVGANSNDTPLVRIPISGAQRGIVDPIIGPVGEDAGGLPLCHDTCDGFTPMAGLPTPDGIDVHGGVTYIAQYALPPALRIVTPQGSIYTLADLRQTVCGAYPGDVAQGLNGDLYWTGCMGVFVLHPDGTSGLLAGSVTASGRNDGTGGAARFLNPKGIAFDGSRYLYVVDSGNSLIRRLDVLTKRVVTIAGSVAGDRDGIGGVARLWGPAGVGLDPWGDVYFTDETSSLVRLVRLIDDPARDPQVLGLAPYTAQEGTHAVISVTGLNLGLTQRATFGSGVQTKVISQSSRALELAVTVSPSAPTGTHPLTVTTFYGKAVSPPGLSLQVLAHVAAPATVTTIAGTGAWSPGIHDGPADKSQFALPTGIAAIDSSRMLVADPIEQRIRWVGTKQAAEPQLLGDLESNMPSAATLDSVLKVLGAIGKELDKLGVHNYVGKSDFSGLSTIVDEAVDNVCKAESSSCAWLALPWAGVALSPGESEGYRESAQMFLPTDVTTTTDQSVFYAADAGNHRARSIGMEPGSPPMAQADMVYGLPSLSGTPFGVADAGNNSLFVSNSERSTIQQVTLEGGGATSPFAGVDGMQGCGQVSGESKPRLGIPLGIATTKDDVFVADPFCDTIWRISRAGGSIADVRGPLAGLGGASGACSDGPVALATFGAPVDVAVDKNGNIWVADAGCNSIREITDVWANKEAAFIGSSLSHLLGGVAKQLPASTVGKIQSAIDSLQPDFIAANRYWVITVAGSRAGTPGFLDGPAGQSLFDGPAGISVMTESNGTTDVFVSDAGNRRIRLLTIPG
jgi:streptogramin lyase